MKAGAIERFVLDASVTLSWVFEDERNSLAEGVLDRMAEGAEALVPAIWSCEIANALLNGERRKRITFAQTTSLVRLISELNVSVDLATTNYVFDQVLGLARQQNLSQYDAAYLDLAVRHSLPLATRDDQLRRAARNIGVNLLV